MGVLTDRTVKHTVYTFYPKELIYITLLADLNWNCKSRCIILQLWKNTQEETSLKQLLYPSGDRENSLELSFMALSAAVFQEVRTSRWSRGAEQLLVVTS